MGIRAKKSSGLLCCSLWRVAAAYCCGLVVLGLLLWSRGAWCSSVLCARALLALRCDALRCVVLCALICSCDFYSARCCVRSQRAQCMLGVNPTPQLPQLETRAFLCSKLLEGIC